MTNPVKVMIVDDHPMVAEGIQSILESYDDIQVVGCLSNGRAAIDQFEALDPDVILMDEPCSALDPVATGRVEELILGLKNEYTIVVVTHNMQQAGRISDRTAFFYLGELIECDFTKKIFINPDKKQTEDYISGKFG